jgi:CheY-like chemotaxis protein
MSKRILVVEDHADNRQIIRDIVLVHGLHRLEACLPPPTTKSRRLRMASRRSRWWRKQRPDLILMDIQLPIIDRILRKAGHAGVGVNSQLTLRVDYLMKTNQCRGEDLCVPKT